jgi:hypothetical protein
LRQIPLFNLHDKRTAATLLTANVNAASAFCEQHTALLLVAESARFATGLLHGVFLYYKLRLRLSGGNLRGQHFITTVYSSTEGITDYLRVNLKGFKKEMDVA